MPFVFTEREIDFARSLPFPEIGLCASFCCKEAMFKALSAPYNFTDCEFFGDVGNSRSRIELSPSMCAAHGIAGARADLIDRAGGANDMIVTIHLFGRGNPEADR